MEIDLSKYHSICIDSCILIYFIQDDKKFSKIINNIFTEISKNDGCINTSFLSLIEILVKPIENNDVDMIKKCKEYMLNSKILHLIPLDEKIAEKSAYIRAKNGIKTPDAIEIATAVITGSDVFITNDKRLQKIKELPVIILDDIL